MLKIESEINLVKQTCKELGITQKELANITNFNEQTLRNWSSKGSMPEYSKTFLKLLSEHKKLKEAVLNFKHFNNYINNI